MKIIYFTVILLLLFTVSSSAQSYYYDVNQQQEVEAVYDSGELVLLRDGSLWSIESYGQYDTRYWYRSATVYVIEDSYSWYAWSHGYKLINLDNNEAVHAKYLGEVQR